MTADYVEYAYRDAEDTWATHYVFPQLVKLLGKAQGPILDLGCGNGATARKLMQAGYDVYGVDASISGIAAANAKAPDKFFVMNVGDAALPAALARVPFCTVISTEVIEHLYDPRSLIRLAKQVLAGRGKLIVSTPYHGYLKNLALAATGKLDGHFTVLWDGGHIKFFSRATLEQLLKEEGFKPTGFEGAGRFPMLWKSMILSATIGA